VDPAFAAVHDQDVPVDPPSPPGGRTMNTSIRTEADREERRMDSRRVPN
jgi:hypothetical protein